jgi:hypothetical protein
MRIAERERERGVARQGKDSRHSGWRVLKPRRRSKPRSCEFGEDRSIYQCLGDRGASERWWVQGLGAADLDFRAEPVEVRLGD